MPNRIYLILFMVAIFTCITVTAIAGEVTYYYDDAGRLTRAVNGSVAAIYQYDEVGNILSVTTGTINPAPPVLSNINPGVIFLGATMQVVITGQNLLTTETITADNPLLVVRTLSVSDASIKLSIDAPSDGQTGGVNLTVTTLFGSADISLTLVSLSVSPQYLTLLPGSVGSITASISPIVGGDTSITVNSSNPTVASAPSIVVIPLTGSITFNVNALLEGSAALTLAGSKKPNASVFVSQPFALQPGESATAATKPVSIYLKPSTVVDAMSVSLPVSVLLQPSPPIDATPISPPVSVFIGQSTVLDGTTASQQISVIINSP